ncbi:DNA topoisomerase III [Pseudovirgaria hyperparasitica]|uniref:DNA topoisomerase n=1 Tax=Pseudovirgaria hyperparasitica TaxID=470096 RepID=A0A6A6W7R2_9PEZI|nr:DNA topoisomerase III [Pseudovirgaria hyperparasitica]KAF2758064.1 DNA topoisomerase III [Pseudovirgaria hyperparasitica]
MRILCVAEKPSIAKAVANHLAGRVVTHNVNGTPYVKNYCFDYNFRQWGQSSVTFTSAQGHITSSDFGPRYKSWQSCLPIALFEADINTTIDDKMKPVAENIRQQSRYAQIVFIWTDCDREGEYIGSEIRDLAVAAKPGIQVKRARFSNIERNHVIQAAGNPVDLDERQVQAVAARIELDFRLGTAFTRMQTLALKPLVEQADPGYKVISYGSCQFPTLGFVVDRYLRVKNFKPEPFWYIKVSHKKDDINVNFTWSRGHLFDRMAVTIMFERCLAAKQAKVVEMLTKPTSKWRPLPLTTLELQKCGSRFLRMTGQEVMKHAEKLYTAGWISYPRTETDQFSKDMDLKKLVEKQQQSQQWGQYAEMLMGGGFNQPRVGRNNDEAHPPIHPVNFVVPTQLSEPEKRVYEFVTRRFLACCSEDAKGVSAELGIEWGVEKFNAKGLTVLQRNYLDVYPYDKWESSQQLPPFTVGETFIPMEAKITDGKTTAPSYLTEPELLSLMDANGIGTDATMHEHVEKIKDRNYVMTRSIGGSRAPAAVAESAETTRGGRGGRGRGRGGRGGAAATARGGSGMLEFIPTTLGVALIEGYDQVGFETSLGKPHLRKEMELQMKAICAGTKTKYEVVQQNLDQYRNVYSRSVQQIDVLKTAIRKYVLQQNVG